MDSVGLTFKQCGKFNSYFNAITDNGFVFAPYNKMRKVLDNSPNIAQTRLSVRVLTVENDSSGVDVEEGVDVEGWCKPLNNYVEYQPARGV